MSDENPQVVYYTSNTILATRMEIAAIRQTINSSRSILSEVEIDALILAANLAEERITNAVIRDVPVAKKGFSASGCILSLIGVFGLAFGLFLFL